MSAISSDNTEGLARTTNIVAGSSDYTAVGWYKHDATPGGGLGFTCLDVRNNAYDRWAGIYTATAGTNLFTLNVENGTGPLTTANATFTPLQWYAVAYVRQGTTHRFYVDGVLIGSVTSDFSAVTLERLELLFDGASGATDNSRTEFGYFREYNAALTLPELIAEWKSATAVRTSNLIASCPLQANANDVSGAGNNFSLIGASVTFSTPTPLLNITPATATEVSSLPFSSSQDVRDGNGIVKTVYYKYTAKAGEKLLGSWGYGDNLSPYTVETEIYQNEALTQKLIDTGSTHNKPVQSRLETGTTYWVVYKPNAGNPNPAILQLRWELGPTISNAVGDYFINDDSAAPQIAGDWKGLPGIVIDKNNGNVKNSFNGIPAGEGADILANGKSLIADAWNDKLKLFDRNFALLTTISATIGFENSLRANHGQNWFYTANGTAVKAYDDAGALQGSWTIASSCRSLAANLAGTVLYHSARTSGGVIRRHNLSTDTAMSDLVAGQAGYFPGDILVLGDDSIVVLYHNTGTLDVKAIRYDSTGATLNTYNFGTSSFPGGGTFPRLSYDTDLTNNFHVMTHLTPTSLGTTRLRKVKVSDGSILNDQNSTEYENGIYNTTVALPLNPNDRFGNSFSCPFFIIQLTESTGTIIVQKVTIPVDTTLFTINTVNLSPASYQLANGNQQVHSGLTPASNYEVSETPNALYDTVISVSNGSPANAIAVAAGETVTVTITNTLKSAATGKITVGKVTNPFNPTQPFPFVAGGGLSPINFTLLSENSQDFNVVPGSGYSIVETLPPGFTLHYMISNDPVINNNLNITVGNGEHVTVMVLDEAFGGGLFFPDPTPPGGPGFPPGTGKTNDTVPGIPNNADVVIPNVFVETAYIRDL